MEPSRQEYWNGLSFPYSWALPDPGIEPWSPALEADSLLFELPEKAVLLSLPLLEASGIPPTLAFFIKVS